MRKANQKKIALNRETLRNLANGDLSDALGGAATTGGTTRGASCVLRCGPTILLTQCTCPSGPLETVAC